MQCTVPLYFPVHWQWALTLSCFYLSNICFQVFLYKYNIFSHFHMIPTALFFLMASFFFLFKIFLFLFIFIAGILKDFQNFFIRSFHKSYIMLNFYDFKWWYCRLMELMKYWWNIDGICSSTFVVNEFSELFLHPSVFSIKHGRSA